MKFTIISPAIHKVYQGHLFAYEPYVREMNLWLKHVTKSIVVAPSSNADVSPIDSRYTATNLSFRPIKGFDLLTFRSKLAALLKLPNICYQIFRACLWADHIHLRCPGNIGLLGCLIQILFPKKSKTAKYAGNWDRQSAQPLSYRFQQWILSNTFLSRNMKVLVYGVWPKETDNIVPFFTASYSETEIEPIVPKRLNSTIRFIFVGSLTVSKQPMLSVRVVETLLADGLEVSLDIYGDGQEYATLADYIETHKLSTHVTLHGNTSRAVVKKALQDSHFLILISQSEGWPKVVAEAMFWSCLPLASRVSCIPFMLDEGNRGAILSGDLDEILAKIREYVTNEPMYLQHVRNATQWSREYTTERFDSQIHKLLTH